ncbi:MULTISPECIES: hypothetical protein [Rhodopseudomonas]|uniref:hypothetical protein n=1 Tax=Rhodopseudomonas TaxID=1073 RepID=UPI00128B292B|nr:MULTISPECIES: hypothetical protein [Rhodopseudomonas]MDF3813689.1 hypothetical protein [Rhodopseudomonas sp. BAL398]WOK18819.1 hypothetical protein RBJ75_04645 [Rhodopseudomonas sp. BAL398]
MLETASSLVQDAAKRNIKRQPGLMTIPSNAAVRYPAPLRRESFGAAAAEFAGRIGAHPTSWNGRNAVEPRKIPYCSGFSCCERHVDLCFASPDRFVIRCLASFASLCSLVAQW